MATPGVTSAADDLVSRSNGQGSVLEVLGVATRLGLTSFGGPVAHLGYFRDEYVKRRQWVNESTYADLLALCQTLPGPASSQVGISLGILRAGIPGGIAAWLGFTLPSAVFMVLFAFVVQDIGGAAQGWLHGLKVVAVAVIAQAVWGMARSLAPDRPRATIAILATVVMLVWPATWPIAVGQVGVLVLAGLVGWRLLQAVGTVSSTQLHVPISHRVAVVSWVLFFVLLLGLPLARQASSNGALQTSSGLALRRVAVELAEKRDPRTHPHPSVLGQTAPNG